MERLADDDLGAALDSPSHQDGLGHRTRPVIHRRVRDIDTEQLTDDGLELEDRLQRALRELGLVGRVGGVELTALQELVDGRRDVVSIHATTEEREHRSAVVSSGERAQVLHQARLIERRLEVEIPFDTPMPRNVGEQRVDVLDPNAREHRANLVVGMG